MEKMFCLSSLQNEISPQIFHLDGPTSTESINTVLSTGTNFGFVGTSGEYNESRMGLICMVSIIESTDFSASSKSDKRHDSFCSDSYSVRNLLYSSIIAFRILSLSPIHDVAIKEAINQ